MKTLTLSFLLLMSGSFAQAGSMDSSTQDLVIKKMERIISQMSPTDSSWAPSQQRLADLLSERARVRFMQETEVRCDGCRGSKSDRQKAIGIYESLLTTSGLKDDGVILFQLAHLYQMGGNSEKAEHLFKSVLRNSGSQKTSQEIITRARVGLGDILFGKGKPSDAHAYYLLALQDKDLDNRPVVTYNMAWCEFNMGQLDKAISTLSNMLAKSEIKDPAFLSDVLKDLATFYSRRTVTESEVNRFEKLIPADQRKEILLHFASEVDRIGQKKTAQYILAKYLADKTLTREERLNATLMKAQIGHDGGAEVDSLQDFANAAEEYQSHGCKKSEDCLKIQKTMKHYVTELHRSKKVKPDAELLKAYVIYTKSFPEDREMLMRGAQVAMDVGTFATAVQFYRNISNNKAFTEKEQNEALLNEVAAAEKSNNPTVRKDSYLYFIKNSTDESKKFEVKYQLAYLAYQEKQIKEAADAFHSLAPQKAGKLDLRKKAADLSLDCLAQLKNDATFEKWSWEYSRVFPGNSREFETLARKSLMNQVATAANDPNSNPVALKDLLNRTLRVSLATATPEERVLFYTNASVLALKVDDQDNYLKAQQALLNQKLSTTQRQHIYETLASYFEKRLDFRQAYTWASKINNPKISKAERDFRLGTLADLSNQNPSHHYRAALKAGLNDSKSTIVRTRLVALSPNPAAELKKQASALKKHPQILNDMVLLVYAKTGNKKAIASLLETKELRYRSAAKFFRSQELYEKIEKHKQKIAMATLRSRTPRELQASLASRVKLLNQADSLLKESNHMKDITAQMMSLEIISSENERLAQELMAVPAPKGLTKPQLEQYQSILRSKLSPYTNKARLADNRRQEIWANSQALASLINDYSEARPEIQKIMSPSLNLLSQVSGNGPLKSKLKEALASDVSMKALASARQAVSQNPENAAEIEKLKNLETKMGHPLMPAYLEARLSHLQRGKSL
jgi:hypothetical protein